MLFCRLAPVLTVASLWHGAIALAEDAAGEGCAGGGQCAAQAGAGASRGSTLVQLKSRLGRKAGAAAGAAEDAEEEEEEELAFEVPSEPRERGGAEREATNISEVLLQAGGTRACTAKERDEFLYYHNALRCLHGSPPVAWSDAVANNANSYISPMTKMKHSKSYDIPHPAGPAGENLYMYSTPDFVPAQVVTLWYSEVKFCKGGPKKFKDGCYSGKNGKPTGHFTAMIWKGVKKIGCAISNDGKIAICRYKSDKVVNSNSANMGPQSNYVKQVPRKIKGDKQCSGSSDSCQDSFSYIDPEYDGPCSTWVGWDCSGYAFSKQLKKKCPKACGEC